MAHRPEYGACRRKQLRDYEANPAARNVNGSVRNPPTPPPPPHYIY